MPGRASPGTELRWGSSCLLYTSDAADERSSVDLGGRRIIKKKKKKYHKIKKKKKQKMKKYNHDQQISGRSIYNKNGMQERRIDRATQWQKT